jgi:predicted alpha/beta-fold hydrolase
VLFDLLCACRIIPQEQVQHNPFTLMAATRRGGHLAFLQVSGAGPAAAGIRV